MSEYTKALTAEQLIRMIAGDRPELSHEKVLLQRNEYIKVCREWLDANCETTEEEKKMTHNQKLNDLKDAVASWRRQRDELEAKHQGVRPSYVSTELAMLEERIQRYTAQIKEIEG